MYITFDVIEMKIFLNLQVNKLKQELQHASDEVRLQQQGINELEEIDRRVNRMRYQNNDNQLIAEQIQTIKRQLDAGEQERHDLLQNLLQLKEGFSFPSLPGMFLLLLFLDAC